MKRILKVLLLIMMVYLPLKVNAASIAISCPESVTVGETFTCTVTGHHNSLAGLKSSINYAGIEYMEVSNLTGSNMFITTNSELDGAFDIATASKDLARYTFKAISSGNASINVVCQEIIDGTDFSSVSCTGDNKTILIKDAVIQNPEPVLPPPNKPAIKNSDATLKGIELSAGTINFVSNIFIYNVEVDYSVENINVRPIANNNKAKVQISGNTLLEVGNNLIKINVTAEDGTTNIYTLNITRKEKNEKSNNQVKNILIENYNLNFDKDKKEYDLLINNEDSLTINVDLEDDLTKYEIIGNKNLKNKSKIIIKIIAEDEIIDEYKVNIIKTSTKSLSVSLTISILFNAISVSTLFYLLIKNKIRN